MLSRKAIVLFKALPALCTFMLGLALTTLWQGLAPAPLTGSEIPVQNTRLYLFVEHISICDLTNHPRLFEDQLVSVEGVVFDIEGEFKLYERCSPSNDFELPVVELSGSPETFDSLHFVKGKESFAHYEADARVIGTIKRIPGAEHPVLRIVPVLIEPLSAPRMLKSRGAG